MIEEVIRKECLGMGYAYGCYSMIEVAHTKEYCIN